jgi:hypothetical protein
MHLVSPQHHQHICCQLAFVFCSNPRVARKVYLSHCSVNMTGSHLVSCSELWRYDMLDMLGLILAGPDQSMSPVLNP